MQTPPGDVIVMGAGTIGCFVGGMLAAAGVPVTFIGRPRVLQALAAVPPFDTTVLSLQNGISNAAVASQAVPAKRLPAILRLAASQGTAAPRNATMVALLNADSPARLPAAAMAQALGL